ncbi:MAG TPA: hypothetical protein VGW38_15025, partial [Chloroflexota bacterium]|nr:hypothetical protein [Chloroflexota bacterium]
PPDSSGPPGAPVAGRRLWFPPYSGQLAIDKSLAKLYRTGAKLLDEAHDHGLEQLRHARFREPTHAPQHVWPVLQQARREAVDGGNPQELLVKVQQQAQQALDQAWSLYEKRA